MSAVKRQGSSLRTNIIDLVSVEVLIYDFENCQLPTCQGAVPFGKSFLHVMRKENCLLSRCCGVVSGGDIMMTSKL